MNFAPKKRAQTKKILFIIHVRKALCVNDFKTRKKRFDFFPFLCSPIIKFIFKKMNGNSHPQNGMPLPGTHLQIKVADNVYKSHQKRYAMRHINV